MFLGVLKTRTFQVYKEVDTFSGAVSLLNNLMKSRDSASILEALILEETTNSEESHPEFNSYKLIASLRTVK